MGEKSKDPKNSNTGKNELPIKKSSSSSLTAVYYNALLNAIEDGFCTLEVHFDSNLKPVDYKFIEMNAAFEELCGLKNAHGKWISELKPGYDPYWLEVYGNVFRSGKDVRVEYFSKDSESWWSVYVFPIMHPKHKQVAVLLKDITECKKNEFGLGEYANFIEHMANATPDILFVMDIESKKIIFSTRNIARQLGYSEEQINAMHNPFMNIMHLDDLQFMVKHVDELKSAPDGEVREIEYRLIDAVGRIHWFRDRNTVFRRDENGVPFEKMGIAQDISVWKKTGDEIKSLNDSLHEKNRELTMANDDLKTFTSIAAYDYKETLRNLYTNLEYIISRDAEKLSNAGKGNIRKAQTAIQRMKLLTEDIVKFSQIQAPDSAPSAVDLNEIVELVKVELGRQIEETGAIIKVDKLPVIDGFPFLLTLLFNNLISNSVKFVDGGAKPRVEIEHSLIPGRNNESMHLISVRDNGIGFKQEEAENVFRMFYKLNDKQYKGSGTGLAICRKIVELHGGSIDIESIPGDGTIVKCYFHSRH